MRKFGSPRLAECLVLWLCVSLLCVVSCLLTAVLGLLPVMPEMVRTPLQQGPVREARVPEDINVSRHHRLDRTNRGRSQVDRHEEELGAFDVPPLDIYHGLASRPAANGESGKFCRRCGVRCQ